MAKKPGGFDPSKIKRELPFSLVEFKQRVRRVRKQMDDPDDADRLRSSHGYG